jgi:glutaredoxin-like YruB-family protein
LRKAITMSDTPQDNTAKITIYSTTWCAFCKTEKQYLDKLGIPFVEKDIESDKEAYEELMAKSGEGGYQGVPVTDIAGTLVLGFDRRKIDEVIKEKGISAVPAAA